jgi:hypothetical protein
MVQLFVNYEKIIFKFVVLSIALARPDTILPVAREITRTKKVYKRIIILGICKMSINIQVCLQCYIVVMFAGSFGFPYSTVFCFIGCVLFIVNAVILTRMTLRSKEPFKYEMMVIDTSKGSGGTYVGEQLGQKE